MKTLSFFCFLIPLLSIAQDINTQITSEGVLFTEGKDTVLFYQTAAKSLNGAFTRSNYIHPLHNLDGTVLTEDFP